jgi:hypothetical protein
MRSQASGLQPAGLLKRMPAPSTTPCRTRIKSPAARQLRRTQRGKRIRQAKRPRDGNQAPAAAAAAANGDPQGLRRIFSLFVIFHFFPICADRFPPPSRRDPTAHRGRWFAHSHEAVGSPTLTRPLVRPPSRGRWFAHPHEAVGSPTLRLQPSCRSSVPRGHGLPTLYSEINGIPPCHATGCSRRPAPSGILCRISSSVGRIVRAWRDGLCP